MTTIHTSMPTRNKNGKQQPEQDEDRALRRAMYRLRQSPLSILGLIMVLLVMIVALAGPLVVPFPEDTTGNTRMSERLTAPNKTFWFGTDDAGRDVFSRTIVATQTSLVVGVIVLGFAILVGVPLGAIAGYMGGAVDETIMRVTDIFMTIPYLLLAMAIAAALGSGIINATIAIVMVWWPGYTRLTRGQVLSLREQEFIESAHAIGAGRWRMIFRHLVPNVLSSVIIKASLDMGFAILVVAGLGYIGVGVQPPMAEWGVMIAEGRSFLRDAWWMSVFPGLAMFITVLGFNLLGDGLRDIFDPKLRR